MKSSSQEIFFIFFTHIKTALIFLKYTNLIFFLNFLLLSQNKFDLLQIKNHFF